MVIAPSVLSRLRGYRRAPVLLSALLIVTGLSIGTTVAAWSDTTSNSSNTLAALATFPIPPPSLVKNLGTASCGDATNILSVPASGVAAGNTVIARFAQRSASTGAVTMTDSKGNTYIKDADRHEGTVRVAVFSAHITTPLALGDTITISHPSGGLAAGVVAAEFSGLAQTNRVDSTGMASGNRATPSAAVTTASAPVLLYGAVASTGTRTYTDPAGWASVNHQALVCGGVNRADNHGAVREVAVAGTYTYNPVMSGVQRWAEVVVAYKRAASCATPGSQTVIANRDTMVDEVTPTVNFGVAQTLYILSELVKNRRLLVGFPLPTVPSGCSVSSATLRLQVDSQVARNINVFRAASAWTEGAAIWNAQPGTTGGAASHTTTVQGLQFEQWTVTTLVQAWYSGGTNDGFTVRDANEGAASPQQQRVVSREAGTGKPELVVQWS